LIIYVRRSTAADLATEYWLLDRANNNTASRASEVEAQLTGRQLRIGSVFLALRHIDSHVASLVGDDKIADLFDSMTGGDFRVVGAGPDAARASAVQANAAELNGDLRSAVALRSRRAPISRAKTIINRIFFDTVIAILGSLATYVYLTLAK
jgi:hypothetical protein